MKENFKTNRRDQQDQKGNVYVVNQAVFRHCWKAYFSWVFAMPIVHYFCLLNCTFY